MREMYLIRQNDEHLPICEHCLNQQLKQNNDVDYIHAAEASNDIQCSVCNYERFPSQPTISEVVDAIVASAGRKKVTPQQVRELLGGRQDAQR